MNLDWGAVARLLEQRAAEMQNQANANAVSGSKTVARNRDETAIILRTLAEAIRAGMHR